MKFGASTHCLVLLLICCSFLFPVMAQESDYPLLYEQQFDSPGALSDFEFTDDRAWRVNEEGSLELFGKSDYNPPVRSPLNIALLRDLNLSDFILEADLAQTGKEYGHRDLCLFFAVRDASNFYYAHLATKADDHANNIFLVNDEPRVKIASQTSTGTDWGQQGQWHKLRIVRKVESGLIEIYFNDMNQPVMTAEDRHFLEGRIGFGSFDDTGMVDNIRIWGVKATPSSGIFK